MGRIGYCSACDRNVPVILRKKVQLGRTPAPGDAEALICLDYGVRCTGALCPLFSVEPLSSLLEPADVRPETRRSGPESPEGDDDLRPPAHA